MSGERVNCAYVLGSIYPVSRKKYHGVTWCSRDNLMLRMVVMVLLMITEGG